MNLELTEEQQMVRRSVREYAANEIAPLAREYDEAEKFPHVQIKGLAELGLLGMIIPEKYGGAGFDSVSYALALEEISKADASVAVIVSVTNSVCCYPILSFGTEEQKQKYLTLLVTGEKLGAFCLSEPQAGSDATGLKTSATEEGDFFVLNGTKSWVTNGSEAEVFIVMAVTGETGGKKEITSFIVEGGTKGFTVSSHEHKMGQRASQTNEMSLVDVRVPKANVLGGIGNGMRVAFGSLDSGRIGVAALSVGIAQAALDESTKYAKDRIAFGKPIAEFQAIQFKLADMAMQTEAARLLTLRAAAAKDSGSKQTGIYASQAKLFASENANKVCAEAIQIHGGNGYSRSYNVEKYYRDARITTIYEGTSEIQKIVISRGILK
ncbi:MAG: acyl-CoA dehydrogenase family protein [Acidobacteriota bacterium]|jgi:alkylation response protein AidB-like acyl-CoA dehydrogenase|nr:acyl-CoA dehydrogenase family protein [Acidobacteriota bacterium]MDQ3372623.1 acyl-CoA dehydrogenase family protein [Acidobacteriota bacterium]